MRNEAITPTKQVATQEVSFDSLFKEMTEWSNRIAKRAYELFAESGFTDGHDLEDWFKAEKEFLKPVALDVKDTKDEFIVRADVPGFDAEDLNIRVNGSHLVIEGKHETEEKKDKGKGGNPVVTERKCQQIYRMVELPAPVVAEKAHADLKNGALEVNLPKAEKAKQIKVVAA